VLLAVLTATLTGCGKDRAPSVGPTPSGTTPAGAGLGGSGGSGVGGLGGRPTSAGPTQLSPADAAARSGYIGRAEAICNRFTPRFNAIPEPSPTADPTSEANYLDQIRALNQAQLTQMEALAQPPADGSVLSSIYSDTQAMIDEAATAVARLRAGQTAEAGQLLSDVERRTVAVNRRYDGYGMLACGSGQTVGDIGTA
jgi:hypothetical protein